MARKIWRWRGNKVLAKFFSFFFCNYSPIVSHRRETVVAVVSRVWEIFSRTFTDEKEEWFIGFIHRLYEIVGEWQYLSTISFPIFLAKSRSINPVIFAHLTLHLATNGMNKRYEIVKETQRLFIDGLSINSCSTLKSLIFDKLNTAKRAMGTTLGLSNF